MPGNNNFSNNRNGKFQGNNDAEKKLKQPKQGMVEMDGEVLEVLPNGICKVKMENGVIVTAYLKGIFKEKKIKVFPQDKVRIEFSVTCTDKGRVIQKYRTNVQPPMAKQTHSSRKMYSRIQKRKH